MGKKRGRAVRKAKLSLGNEESEEVKRAPHTFVIYRGRIGKNCNQLMLNFRKIMEPFTASHLKVQKRNVIKDFVAVSGLLHVTNMVIFTKSETAMYMRVIRLPRGPTLTFRINNYSLAKDVLSSLKKRVTYSNQFSNHPLLVLNNFSGEGLQLKLMTSMFQNMFPSININKVKLNTIRRCLMLNYNSETNTIDLRHYTIKVVPCGLSKSVKKLINSKIPDLGRLEDISEFVTAGGANLSESEAEPDGPFNQVTLPQKIASRGNETAQKSAIRLVELGPRMTLELIKIEEGLMEGDILYHALIEKSPEEIAEAKIRRDKQKKLKAQRKKQQNENKKKKEAEKEQRKSKNTNYANEKVEHDSEEDAKEDAEWYEIETGDKPDTDLFPALKRKAKRDDKILKKPRFQGKNEKSTKKVTFKDQKEGESKNDKPANKYKKRDQDSQEEKVKPLMTVQEILKRRKKRKEAKKKKMVIRHKSKVVGKHIKQTRKK